jgi:glycosyltransferase involved in cell wall biosynthesis
MMAATSGATDHGLKVWIPSLAAGSGADVFDNRLSRALADIGIASVVTPVPLRWQFLPWRLKYLRRPSGTFATIANAQIAFAIAGRGLPVVGVVHHCIADPSFDQYRNIAQSLFHHHLVRRYESATLRSVDAVVAVSKFTARSLRAVHGGSSVQVISNGIETDYFCPDPQPKSRRGGRPVRLLFVGNLTARKGADLLPKIMTRLGAGFELRYTSGLRAAEAFPGASGMVPLGRLTRDELRREYRHADLLLFPTRLEGFGYAVAEAMACGTPVVTTRCSAMPELVDDGRTGRLCAVDDIDGFAEAVRELTADEELLLRMGRAARVVAAQRFSLSRMAHGYATLLAELGCGQLGA